MQNTPNTDPEFTALMPPLGAEEYNQLEQNILLHRKVSDPILLWNNTIIDGFNRFCICVTHGIRFEVKEVAFNSKDEAKIWIIENQLGKRNLNDAQRIELALCKEEVLRAKAKARLSSCGGDKTRAGAPFSKKTKSDEAVNVHKAIAKEANVSDGTLHNYNQIKDSGNTDLLTQVQKGELKIGTAHRMLLPEIEKQLDNADRMLAYIKKYLPRLEKGKSDSIREELHQLAMSLRGYLACAN